MDLLERSISEKASNCPPPNYYEYVHDSRAPQPREVSGIGSYEQYHPLNTKRSTKSAEGFYQPNTPLEQIYYYSEGISKDYPEEPKIESDYNYLNRNEKISTKLDALVSRISNIDTKLEDLQHKIYTNVRNPPVASPDELIAAASESYRVDHLGLGARRQQSLCKNQDMRSVGGALDRVHDSMEELNQRFMEHAALNTEQLEHMIDNMVQVRQAVLIHGPVFFNHSEPVVSHRGLDGLEEPVSKLDVLVEKVTPLQEVRKKMDEVWSVLVGTKSSVDVLVPKSDALLNNSQRQERAILQFSTNLSEKTDRIIQNLGNVEKKLENMPRGENQLNANGEEENSPNPISLLHKTTTKLHLVAAKPLALTENIQVQDEKEATLPKIQSNVTSTKFNIGSIDIVNRTAEFNESKKGIPSIVKVVEDKKSNASIFVSPSVNDDTTGYSCSDLMRQGHTKSGNYHIRIRGTTYWFLKVNCEMDVEDGGWTVIQRRDDFGKPRENFNRDWNDYKHGFGDPEREFYLGNENIYLLTNTQEHILRVELEDFEGNKRYAEYSTFKLHSELDLYKLEIGGYKGNAGNSLNDPWYGSNLSPFSTFDRDNDRSSLNCASMLKGGWWWRSCGRGLNGLYITKANDNTGRQGIIWFRWRGWDYSLKKSVILIRPKSHTESASYRKQT